ncbi:MAG: glycosyltransferase family 39 protein, partial [Chloroflexi bacterium]|nr:glycosyltransferase family 39 protein [Chloroflexota bacterium]
MSRKGSRLAVRPRILITAILLLAFGLRVIKPDFLGLNDDEAFFVQIAHLGTYLDAMRSSEPHPPLYLALLQGWMDVAGVTEYGIRFLSILTGVAMVAAMYQLGKQVLGEALGLAAAFAAALNPYQILYSQTARNYEMACLFGALSFVALLRARRDARLIPGFVICALLALYSHYYTIAIVGFEALLVASWLWGRPWPSWRPWVAAAGVVALLYVPWLLFVARTIAGYNPGHGDPDIVWRAFNDSFHYYGFGQAFDPSAIFWPGIGIALLVVLGIAGLALLSRRALGLSIGYQLAPILGGMATFVHTNQYGPRFIFIGQPGFLLIAGGAVLLLSRLQWAQLAPLAFISYLGGQAVYNTVLTDRFVTEGYRPLASYLARHISAGDAVILDGISQWNQYWYYAILRNGVTNRVEFMPKDASGGGADMTTVDRPKTESALASVAATVPGLWFIDADSLRYDPNMLTENLLAQHWYQAITTHFVYQRLQYYSTAAPAQLAAKDATEGDLRLKQASPLPARVAAGQPLTVSLVWDTVRTGPAAFKESLRLIAPDGTIAAQQDEAPWGGFFQASTWRPGNLLTDNHALVVPVGTVPGAYEVQIVAYEGRSGKGLGDPVSLGKVDVDHSLPQQVAASDLPRLGTPNDCGI